MIKSLVKRGRYYHGQVQVDGMPCKLSKSMKTWDKQVATKRLDEWARELELEQEGIIPPKIQRDAAKTSLASLVADYCQTLEAKGKSLVYVRRSSQRLTILARACGWQHLKDISPASFETWVRKNGGRAARTLNHYLDVVQTFLNWLVLTEQLPANPLERLKKVSTKGKETRLRRALTVDEVCRLLAVAGPLRPVFALAVHTGIRRSELEALKWGDLSLDEGAAVVRLRASTTKNRKFSVIPLAPALAAYLRTIRPADVSPGDRVYPRIPCMGRLMKYWEQAGVPYVDELGRVADFHSFRMTFNTELQKSGVPPRIAQELLRHSDIKLTMQVYTDASQLPLESAVTKLPAYFDGLTHRLTQTPVPTCPKMAKAGTDESAPASLQPALYDTVSRDKSRTDSNLNWRREGD